MIIITQKVIKIGSSAGITLSKATLDELGVKIGDNVSVEYDKKRRSLQVKPEAMRAISSDDREVARLTEEFIDRYKQDLDELSRL